jgi:hypothetical protein
MQLDSAHCELICWVRNLISTVIPKRIYHIYSYMVSGIGAGGGGDEAGASEAHTQASAPQAAPAAAEEQYHSVRLQRDGNYRSGAALYQIAGDSASTVSASVSSGSAASGGEVTTAAFRASDVYVVGQSTALLLSLTNESTTTEPSLHAAAWPSTIQKAGQPVLASAVNDYSRAASGFMGLSLRIGTDMVEHASFEDASQSSDDELESALQVDAHTPPGP